MFPRRSTSTSSAAHPSNEPRPETKTARYTGLHVPALAVATVLPVYVLCQQHRFLTLSQPPAIPNYSQLPPPRQATGGDEGIRTPDLCLAKAPLSR